MGYYAYGYGQLNLTSKATQDLLTKWDLISASSEYPEISDRSLESIFHLFGMEFEKLHDENTNGRTCYHVTKQEEHYNNGEIEFLTEWLNGFCETDDFFEFTGSDDEKWMFHYNSDTGVFTQHNGITQVLYPTLYEKDKRILRGIDSEEVTV